MDQFLYDIGLRHERVNIDVREVRWFLKETKACGKEIFSHPVEVTESMYFGNIFRIMWIPKI